MSTIREIVFMLEARTEHLLGQFRAIEDKINQWQSENPFDALEESDKVRPMLEEMIVIFTELKPIEKLIRFKFKQYDVIFDKLAQIIHEKENGKFFSFLAHSPFAEKRKYNKRALPAPTVEGQSTIS